MNDKQEKRQAMERWERINDYGDAGVKHTHKKYKPSTVWLSWPGTIKKEGNG